MIEPVLLWLLANFWLAVDSTVPKLNSLDTPNSDMAHNGYFVKINVFIVEFTIIIAMVLHMPVIFYASFKIWGIKASAIMIYLHSSMVLGCLFSFFGSIPNYPSLLPPLGIHIRGFNSWSIYQNSLGYLEIYAFHQDFLTYTPLCALSTFFVLTCYMWCCTTWSNHTSTCMLVSIYACMLSFMQPS